MNIRPSPRQDQLAPRSSLEAVASARSIQPVRNRAAFTLVEVTLAIGILAFAFVSIFSLLPISLTQAREAMDRTHATRIQQMLIAQVQQTRFTEVDSKVIGKVFYFDGEGQILPTALQNEYVYTARVLSAPGNGANHTARGLTQDRARTLAVRIGTNRLVSSGPTPTLGERQMAFLISDVAL